MLSSRGRPSFTGLKVSVEIELEVGVDPECLVKSGLGESVVLRGSGDLLRRVQGALSSQLTLLASHFSFGQTSLLLSL